MHTTPSSDLAARTGRRGAPADPPVPSDRAEITERWARRWMLALPVWAGLLAASTITRQPDPAADFEAYARYITTTSFRLSHVLASVGGAGLGIVGATALALVLGRTTGARRAWRWLPVFVLGQVLTISVVGAAAFAQPAIGAVYRDGAPALARRVDELVYSAPLFATAIVGLSALVAGSVGLGRAVGASGTVPAWAARTFVASSVVFPIAGLPGLVVQPVAALALAGASGAIVRALRKPAGSGSAGRAAVGFS